LQMLRYSNLWNLKPHSAIQKHMFWYTAERWG
jgi:hypothetical protein